MTDAWLYLIPGVFIGLALAALIQAGISWVKSSAGPKPSDRSVRADPTPCDRSVDAGTPPSDRSREPDRGNSQEDSMSDEFQKRMEQQIVQKDNLLKLLKLQVRNLGRQLGDGDETAQAALNATAAESDDPNATPLEGLMPASPNNSEFFSRLNKRIVAKDNQIRDLQRRIKTLKDKIDERDKTATRESP